MNSFVFLSFSVVSRSGSGLKKAILQSGFAVFIWRRKRMMVMMMMMMMMTAGQK